LVNASGISRARAGIAEAIAPFSPENCNASAPALSRQLSGLQLAFKRHYALD
jgi:hypothetical protein